MLAGGLSLEEIGRRTSHHPSTVGYWARKHGLDVPLAGRHRAKGGIERERLSQMVARGLTTRAIAEEVGLSPSTVRHWLRRYGMRTQRGRTGWTAAAGERFLDDCRRHGRTTFVARTDGQRRCLRCRSEAVASRRRRIKELLVAEAGGACVLCGYRRCVAALHFHHIDATDKRFSLGHAGITRSLAEARAEAAKCALLCANCHAEVESGTGPALARLAAAASGSPEPRGPG